MVKSAFFEMAFSLPVVKKLFTMSSLILSFMKYGRICFFLIVHELERALQAL
jgi:hypothetical protein